MSLISEESINTIRDKVNLVDVVSDYVALKKTGRSHKGLCPFHKEKTPSFVVDGQKQLFHCFGCQEGGNVFNFMMKVENLEFSEAVEFCAKKAGVAVDYVSREKGERTHSQKERHLKINKEAAEFYHYLLMKGDNGKVAREYLKKRAYGKNIATTFKLGYAPLSNRSLINVLLKKGYKQAEINALDLAHNIRGENRDRFFGRLMFPIEDARGNIVGFGGRALSKEGKPKYLNSSQTPLFNKSRQFYGLNLAKTDIVNDDQAILVEGYTDVISMHKGGFKNTVATLGTALTPDHVQILARFCSSAVMLYDSDAAGLKAAERSVEFINLTNLELLVAVLPEGDPDDYILSKGSKKLKEVLVNAVPVMDFCISQIIENADLSTSKKRLLAINKALNLIASLRNAILEQEYLQKLAKLVNVPIQGLTVEYNKKKKPDKENTAVKQSLTAVEKAENLLLAILAEKPDLAKNNRIVEPEDFFDEQNRELFKLLLANEGKDISKIVDETENALLVKRLSALCFETKPKNVKEAYIDLNKRIKGFALKREINKMKNVLEKTNPVDNQRQYDKLFKQLIALEAKRRDLEKISVGA